jgi:mono/diheme cytochrome c family protein
VLERYCAGCHGAERQKGRLRLDSLAHLLAGGASGPVVVPGDPEASPLFRRLLLPLDTEDHMPPAGKPQPSAAEIERLRAWIRAGLRSSPRPPAEAGLRKASS